DYVCTVVSTSARFLSTVRKVSIHDLGLAQYSSSLWMPVSSVDIKLKEVASTIERKGFDVAPSRRNACVRLSKTLKWLPKEKMYCFAWPVFRFSTRISSPLLQVWLAKQRERSRKEPTSIWEF